jgi:hypothetical protein
MSITGPARGNELWPCEDDASRTPITATSANLGWSVVSTRTLLVLAALTALAILVAGAVQYLVAQ